MSRFFVDTEELLDTQEACQELGIGYATIYRWIKKGQVTVLKIGGRTLIPKPEIERLKKEGCIKI